MQHDCARLLIDPTRPHDKQATCNMPAKSRACRVCDVCNVCSQHQGQKVTKPVDNLKRNVSGQELTDVICPKVGRQLLVSIPCSAVQIAVELASLILLVILWCTKLHAQTWLKHQLSVHM